MGDWGRPAPKISFKSLGAGRAAPVSVAVAQGIIMEAVLLVQQILVVVVQAAYREVVAQAAPAS